MADIIDKSFDYWYKYIKQQKDKERKVEKFRFIFSF